MEFYDCTLRIDGVDIGPLTRNNPRWLRIGVAMRDGSTVENQLEKVILTANGQDPDITQSLYDWIEAATLLPVPLETLMASAMDRDYIGYCYKCGYEHECIEPDAHNYRCMQCDCMSVYGVDEIIAIS